jgi:peroxiredoxin
MRRLFLFIFQVVFIDASSQAYDSLEIEGMLATNKALYKIDIVGKQLPEFSAKDTNGTSYSLKSIKNSKVTFVNLWFTNCPPCIAEIPGLNRLYSLMKDSLGFQFIAITWDPESRAKATIKKYEIQFPVLMVTPKEALQLTFGRGYPTNMVVDKDGIIRSTLSGGITNPESRFDLYWRAEIEKLLRESEK